jgi:diaminopimelate decarboxylase
MQELLPHSQLYYSSGKLHLDTIPLEKVAEKFSTPAYVYSERVLKQHYQRFVTAAVAENLIDPLVCFALKANPNPALVRILGKMGAGADIVSGGELQMALKAGIDPSRIVFSGVGKTEAEMKMALSLGKQGIYSFNVESAEELETLNFVAKKLGKKARVALRLNPEVHVLTHKHISTGHKTHKFGILKRDLLALTANSDLWRHCHLAGLSIHIGSQLKDLSATQAAIQTLSQVALELERPLEFVDVGGGLGVDYSPDDRQDYSTPEQYMKLVATTLRESLFSKITTPAPRVVFEPGRSIIARAGVFLMKVIRNKVSEDIRFAIVDGGMNDFVRASLYGAYHEILPERQRETALYPTEVVGPICETTDCFATGRPLPELAKGDLLAVCDVGAYGKSMASTYNCRQLPQEVLISERGALKKI